MTATIRLMQKSGVIGPTATIEVPEDREGQEQAAKDWAACQFGHPWDLMTVTTPIDSYEVASVHGAGQFQRFLDRHGGR